MRLLLLLMLLVVVPNTAAANSCRCHSRSRNAPLTGANAAAYVWGRCAAAGIANTAVGCFHCPPLLLLLQSLGLEFQLPWR